MMVTYWIVEIMPVMILMPTQEFGGTVMMKISLKLVILPKGVILERVTKNNKKNNKNKVMSG